MPQNKKQEETSPVKKDQNSKTNPEKSPSGFYQFMKDFFGGLLHLLDVLLRFITRILAIILDSVKITILFFFGTVAGVTAVCLAIYLISATIGLSSSSEWANFRENTLAMVLGKANTEIQEKFAKDIPLDQKKLPGTQTGTQIQKKTK